MKQFKSRPKRTDAMEHADPLDRRLLELLYGRNDDSLIAQMDGPFSDHHDVLLEDLGGQDLGCGVGNDLCLLK